MPEIIETTVYHLNELAEGAKKTARLWFLENALDYEWWDFIFDDFEKICDVIGINLDSKTVRLGGGGYHQKPQIFFTGFSQQGDGACYEGQYSYVPGAAQKIRVYAPDDTVLHGIVDALQAVQKRNFYQLKTVVSHYGRYYHDNSMSICVERDSHTGQSLSSSDEDIVIAQLRSLARWLYQRLETEYNYQTSQPIVDAGILANEYTFTESGRRFG